MLVRYSFPALTISQHMLRVLQNKWRSLCNVAADLIEAGRCHGCGMCDNGSVHLVRWCPACNIAVMIVSGSDLRDPSSLVNRHEPRLMSVVVAIHHWIAVQDRRRGNGQLQGVDDVIEDSAKQILDKWWHMLKPSRRSNDIRTRVSLAGVTVGRTRRNCKRSSPCECQQPLNHAERVTVARIGQGVRADCPDADTGSVRWVAKLDIPAGDTCDTWNDDDDQILVVRQVATGLSYNVVMEQCECDKCGIATRRMRAVRTATTGDELVTHCVQGLSDCQTLIICFDGSGGSALSHLRASCGLVGYVYSSGVAHPVTGLPIPLLDAAGAQEAEAAGAAVLIKSHTHILATARGMGFKPIAPDLVCGDSKNTTGALTGQARLKARKVARWLAGINEVCALTGREIEVRHVARSLN